MLSNRGISFHRMGGLLRKAQKLQIHFLSTLKPCPRRYSWSKADRWTCRGLPSSIVAQSTHRCLGTSSYCPWMLSQILICCCSTDCGPWMHGFYWRRGYRWSFWSRIEPLHFRMGCSSPWFCCGRGWFLGTLENPGVLNISY